MDSNMMRDGLQAVFLGVIHAILTILEIGARNIGNSLTIVSCMQYCIGQTRMSFMMSISINWLIKRFTCILTHNGDIQSVEYLCLGA